MWRMPHPNSPGVSSILLRPQQFKPVREISLTCHDLAKKKLRGTDGLGRLEHLAATAPTQARAIFEAV
jgi:hypothetical protein